MSRRRILLVLAGLALLGALVLVPRPAAWRAPRAAAPHPAAAREGEADAVGSARPAWPPTAPPPRTPKPRPAANPLDQLSRGITALPSGEAGTFVLRDRDANVFFGPQGLTIALVGKPAPGAGPAERKGYVLQWGLEGAAEVAPRAEGELKGKVNHFRGEPSAWKSGQPTYESVVYEGVRPGVDLVVESQPQAVKYTLHADRAADAGPLRFRYDGAHEVRVAPDGASLEIETLIGTLRESELKCWQDGPEGRRELPARYVSAGLREYAIELEGVDPELPLTVDPKIGWSSFHGGASSPLGDDYPNGIAVDTAGNVYVVGYTYCTDFPSLIGPYNVLGANFDGFLIKINAAGTTFAWATYLGGSSYDYAHAVAVDGSDRPVVVGYTASFDFPTTAGAYDTIQSGYDCFVMRFSTAGALQWSTFLGGTSSDYGRGVAVEAGTGNVYVAGYTYSSNFPIVGGFDASLSTTPDGFVAKLAADGKSLIWSSYLGGNGTDQIEGVAADGLGNVYVGGYTYSTDLLATAPLDTTLGGSVDGFVAKLKDNPLSVGLTWLGYLGGAGSDYVLALTVTDTARDPVVTGYTSSADYPTTAGVLDPTLNSTEAFVTRVKADGSGLFYSTYLGGTSLDYGYAIAAGAADSVYVGGYTYSTNFPTVVPSYRSTSVVTPDGFIAQMNATGTLLLGSTYLGGNDSDYVRGLAVRGAYVYATGHTYSSNFPQPAPAAVGDPDRGGTVDGFAVRLALALNTTVGSWSTYVGGSVSRGDEAANDLAVVPGTDAVVIAGYTTSLDFPMPVPKVGAVDGVLDGLQDAFVTRVSTVGGVPVIDWWTYLGGNSYDSAFGVAVDSTGYVWVTGNTQSADFPVPGAYDATQSGVEAFVTLLTSAGTIYRSTFLGGNSSDYGRDVAVDSSLNAYIVGYTYSADLPVLNAFDSTLSTGPDVFVAKFNLNAVAQWVTYLGGAGSDYGFGVAADGAGSCYVTGYTQSADFVTAYPLVPSVDNSYGGSSDAFVSRINTTGVVPSLAWSRFLGGTNSDYGQAMAVNSAGTHLYAVGYTYSVDFPLQSPVDNSLGGGLDCFATRLDPATGNHNSLWSTFLGGNSTDIAFGAVADASGNLFVTGYTYSSDFPNKGAFDSTINGSADVFVTKMYGSGGAVAWSSYLGGSSLDYGYGIGVSSTGVVFVTGQTQSSDFPATLGALDSTLGGSQDAFLARIDKSDPDLPDFSAGGTGQFKIWIDPATNTPLPAGGWTNLGTFTVVARLVDSDDDQVKLQVEIQPLGTPFDGLTIYESGFVSSGTNAVAVVTLAGTPPQEYHWRARTVDADGLASAWASFGANAEDVRDLGLDNVPPAVQISTPTALDTYFTQGNSVALTGTASDDDAGLASIAWASNRAVVPASGTVPATSPWSIPSVALLPGVNRITVTVTDAAGNQNSDFIDVVKDNTLPTPLSIDTTDGIAAASPYVTGSDSVVLGLTAADPAPGQLDEVTWVNYRGGSGSASLIAGSSWTATVSGLSPGANDIVVTATDMAGNASTAPITLYYDTAPPLVAIGSPANGLVTQAGSLPVSGSASDNVASPPLTVTVRNLTTGDPSIACTYNGATWSSNANVVLTLTAGPNVIEARAVDYVGNVSTTTVTVYHDVDPPGLVITFPGSSPYVTGAPTISLTGTATDDIGLASVTWTRLPAGHIDGDAGGGTLVSPGATSSGWTISGVPLWALPTDNTIRVTVTDTSGRTTFLDTVVRYDTSAPTVTVSTMNGGPPSNPFVTSSATVTIAGSASDSTTIASMTCTNTTTATGFPVSTTPSLLPQPVPVVTSWTTTVTLVAGTNQVTITASDGGLTTNVSLTLIYDPTAPAVKITGPTTADDYYTGTGSITLSGTASDNRSVTSITWSTGGPSNPASGLGPWTAGPIPLTAGVPVTITITASDQAGNTAIDTLVVTYDPDQPDVTITAPTVADTYITNSGTLSGLTALSGTAGDGILLNSVTWVNAANGLSGTASGTDSWSVTSITLKAGPNPITVIATDAAGNLKTDSITVYYDTENPEVAITDPTSASSYLTNAGTVALSGTATDDVQVATVTWTRTVGMAVVASGTADGTASWSIPDITLDAGNNVIAVTATDEVGRFASASITIHYDPNAPLLGVTTPAGTPSSTSGTPLDVAGTASDTDGSGAAAVGVQVIWSNTTTGGSGTALLVGGLWTAQVPLTSGTNQLQFTATDAAGNSTALSRTVVYDAAAPFVDISTPTTDLTFTTGTSPAVLGGMATDDIGVVAVTWSTNGAVAVTSGPADYSGTPNWTASVELAPGANVITITAEDGEMRTGTARITIIYDPTPPTIAVTTPTAEALYLTTVSPIGLAGSASDNLEVQSVAWSNGSTGEIGYALGTGAWSIGSVGLVEGVNVITVTATDTVGNTGSAVLTVIYDGTPPLVQITTVDGVPPPVYPTPYPTTTRPLPLAGTASDNLNLVSITWTNSRGGGGTFWDLSSPGPASPWSGSVYLFPGALPNIITVTATDEHGHTTSDPIVVDYTPESGPPNIRILAPSATGSAVSGTQVATVSGDADDNVGVVRVRWVNLATRVRGDAVLTPTADPLVVDWSADIPLTDGANIIVVTAYDDAGNTTAATITITFSGPSDALPPEITVTGPTLADVYDANVSPLLVTLATLDNVGVASVTWVNAATGGDGVAEPVLLNSWTTPVALALGPNLITFTARDAAGNTATDSLLVTFAPLVDDGANPTVTITSHPTGAPLPWSSATIDLAGTASDNVALAAVIWLNSLGPSSGSADGTDAWSTTLLLVPGINVITMRAYDTSGRSGFDQITIVYTPPPPPPEYVPGGHCGLLGLDGLALLALLGLRRYGRRRPSAARAAGSRQ
jgi:hypothetical protein